MPLIEPVHEGLKSYSFSRLDLAERTGFLSARGRELLFPIGEDADRIETDPAGLDDRDATALEIVSGSDVRINCAAFSGADESRRTSVLSALGRCIETVRSADGWLLSDAFDLADFLRQTSHELAADNPGNDDDAFLLNTELPVDVLEMTGVTLEHLATELVGEGAADSEPLDFECTHFYRVHVVHLDPELPTGEALRIVAGMSSRVFFVGTPGNMFTLLPVGRNSMIARRLGASQVFELIFGLVAAETLPLFPSVQLSTDCARRLKNSESSAGPPKNPAILNSLAFLAVDSGVQSDWPWLKAVVQPELTVDFSIVSESAVGSGRPERRQISVLGEDAVAWRRQHGLLIAQHIPTSRVRSVVSSWHRDFLGQGGAASDDQLRFGVEEIDHVIDGSATTVGHEGAKVKGAIRTSLYFLAGDSMIRGREIAAIDIAERGPLMETSEDANEFVFEPFDADAICDDLFSAVEGDASG